jgi:hypothetical protein
MDGKSGEERMPQRQSIDATMYAFYGRLTDACLLVDTETGEVSPAFLFVSVLGASGYCYAEACLTESVDDWFGCHLRAFHVFGGVPQTVIPFLLGQENNLAAKKRYKEMIGNFCAIVRTFDDTSVKKHLEIQVVVCRFAALLQQRVFTNLPDLNAFILNLVQDLNDRSFKRLPGSRKDLVELFERSCLNPLPPLPSSQTIWLRKQVPADFHIDVDGHYYSVPHQIVGQWVDIRITSTRVTFFAKEKRIASHARMLRAAGRSTTKKKHASKLSNKVAPAWSPDRVLRWANQIGPATAYLITDMLAHANQSQSGVRACLGILSLETQYGRERLEAACRVSATCKSWTVNHIRQLLKLGLDQNSVQLTIPKLLIPPPSDRGKRP